MNHCSFYCKQSLSISHLEMIYLGQDTELCYNVHDLKDPDWQVLCERGPGHRYKMCHARYAGYRSVHITQCTRCYVSVTSHVTRDVTCHAACHNPSHPSIVFKHIFIPWSMQGKVYCVRDQI